MSLKFDYSEITREYGVEPYVLPPFPCGWYEYTDTYGEKYTYQFRRMPRAGKHTGKYGLWLKDADAGMVLIAVVKDGVLVPEGRTYNEQFNAFNLTNRQEAYTDVDSELALTKRTCSWCGRELLDNTRLCHDTPKCTPKS